MPNSDKKDREKQIEQLIADHWGTRCKQFMPGCPICEAWYLYEKGVIPTNEAVQQAIQRASRYR